MFNFMSVFFKSRTVVTRVYDLFFIRVNFNCMGLYE